MNHKKTSINQPKNWKSISNHSQGNVSIYLSPSFPSVVSPKISWNSLRWSLLVLWKHRKNRYLGVLEGSTTFPTTKLQPLHTPKVSKGTCCEFAERWRSCYLFEAWAKKSEKLVKLVEDSSQCMRLRHSLMLFFSICWFILLQRLAVSWRSLEFQISFSQIRFPQGRKQGSTLMPMEKTRQKVWILWLRLGLGESSWLSL